MPYDGADISPELARYYESRARKAIETLERSSIHGVYAPTPEQGLAKLIELIGKGTSIGVGDSTTLAQIGFHSWLRSEGIRDHAVFFPQDRDAEGYFVHPVEEVREIARKALTADVFVTGTNAITLDGKLVNVDGGGNRAAAMIFGPGTVIMVAGANKIVENEGAARQRIREISAPLTALRHAVRHHHGEVIASLPCARTGWCAGCRAAARICCSTLTIGGQPEDGVVEAIPGRIHVIIVGKRLGY